MVLVQLTEKSEEERDIFLLTVATDYGVIADNATLSNTCRVTEDTDKRGDVLHQWVSVGR